jgi:hypothetical protein
VHVHRDEPHNALVVARVQLVLERLFRDELACGIGSFSYASGLVSTRLCELEL